MAADPDFTRALFSGDAARSLVRESIQNSLDARQSPSTPVSVRFTLRSGSSAAEASKAVSFFDGIWEHIHADTSGIDSPPNVRDRIPFLVVEDFGTKGLTGSPEGWDPFTSERNAFFLFFRALGRSGKKDEERGRWGVGKFVFPLASHAHCLLGYTVPFDSRTPLLMGRAVLKIHKVSETAYHPDGLWGSRSSEESLVLPGAHEKTLEEFRRVFAVLRRSEPGLSVVVPWLSVDLNGESLRSAAVAEYFLPILRSELTVEIDDNGALTRINADTIVDLASQIDSPELRARVDLAVEAATWPSEQLIRLPAIEVPGDAEWGAAIPQEVKTHLTARLEEGKPIGVRLPVTVLPKGKPSAASHFDVFIKRVDGIGRARPLIVREGITIPDDKKTPSLQDHVALILIDHKPLAGFIGDAETPAHTELQPELVKNKYTFAPKIIKTLRYAATDLVRTLEQASDSDDFALLSEFFPVASAEEPGRRKQPHGAGTGPDVPPVPPIPAASPRYRVVQTPAGFRVKGTDDGDLPPSLTVRFAYDVRRGNPLKRFNPLDFSLLRPGLSVRTEGVTIVDKAHNTLIAQPVKHGFSIEIDGFDPLRDLVVRVDAPPSEVTP